MAAKKIILYLGKQEKFQRYFLSYKEKYPDFNHLFKQIDCSDSHKLTLMIKEIIEHKVDFLIIESHLFDVKSLKLIKLLKSHSTLKNMKVATGFVDKKNQAESEHFYAFGLDYSFLVTEEIELVFKDIMSLIEDSSVERKEFATVSEVSIPLSASFLTCINSFSENKLFLESTLCAEDGEVLEVEFSDSPEPLFKKVVIKNLNSFMPRSSFEYGLECESLNEQEEALRMDLNSFDTALDSDKNFLIIDKHIETLRDLIIRPDEVAVVVKGIDKFSINKNLFELMRPQVIFYQMEAESEDLNGEELLKVNGATTFEFLINTIKSSVDYFPYVLVFNERSRSQAYRKVFNYKNIVNNPKSFEIVHLDLVLDGYKKQVNDKQKHFLKTSDTQLMYLKSMISIKSLSEKYITFSSKKLLSTFITFKLNTPTFSILITVVPNLGDQTENTYTGLITSASEEEKQEIRKLVNMLLKLELKPDEEFLFKSADQLQDEAIANKKEELLLLRKVNEEEYLKLQKIEKDEFK